jgi:hypothetical protein
MGDDFITPLGLLRIQYASSLIPVPQSAQTAKPGKTRSGIRMTARSQRSQLGPVMLPQGTVRAALGAA